MTCPLCGHNGIHTLAEIDASDIVRAYHHQFAIATGPAPTPVIALRECDTCELRFYDPAWAGDESLYDQLQENPWYYLQDKEEYGIAAGHIGPEDRVLEVGAGDGRFAAHITAGSYRGLELNARAISRARERGVDLRQETIQDHAREHRGAYDVVCHFQVLEHVDQPRSFLEACVACLQPGGRLIVSVPNEGSFVGAEANNLLNLPPHHVSRWTPEALAKAGALVGLRSVAVEFDRLSDFHLKSYARCVAQAALRRWLHRPRRPLDPFFRHVPVRAVVWALSAAVQAGLAAETDLRPEGHSVVAVFERINEI